jgi:hypothetical protein
VTIADHVRPARLMAFGTSHYRALLRKLPMSLSQAPYRRARRETGPYC